MKKLYRVLLIIFTILVSTFQLSAQTNQTTENSAQDDWEQLADELLDDDEITDYESWWQRLEETKLNPLNLNTVSFDSLNMLGLLSERQIENILQFRKE